MARPIDANALKEYIAEYIMPVVAKGNNVAFDFINAKRLTHCRDCVRNPKNGIARTICPCPMDRYMGDEGFCSKAMTKKEPK